MKLKKLTSYTFTILTAVVFLAFGSAWAQEDPVLFVRFKEVDTSLNKTYQWTIEKSADQTELLLAEGQQFQVNYSVIVDTAGYTESGWHVEGEFLVRNAPDVTTTITDISVVISPAIVATVTPVIVFPHNSPPGEYMWLNFSADLPDGSTRTITVDVTTSSGAAGSSHSATVDFSTATVGDVIDECIDVADDLEGPLGTVCATGAPYQFDYSMFVGPYQDPDCEVEVTNTASFVTNDTSTTGDDSWTVIVRINCYGGGCTLTPGYWKTHSEYGPAPYDDTWALLPQGADSPFFLSGQTFFEVLWTPPKGGNAYYILAHAYIAAALNMLNGSDPTVINDAFADATALLAATAPGDFDDLKGRTANEVRALWIGLAEILDDYNNGLTGPGHCDEDQAFPIEGIRWKGKDVNGDGNVDAQDIQLVINTALGF